MIMHPPRANMEAKTSTVYLDRLRLIINQAKKLAKKLAI
jgi:hypothetical protein